MKPSVGRIVHYVSYGTPGGEYPQECRAAIVTQVYATPGVVALAVLNPTGLFFNPSVREDQGAFSDTPGAPSTPSYDGGTWHWPEIIKEA